MAPTAAQAAAQKHPNLATALAAFQAELPKLTKDEKATVKGQTKDGRQYDRSYGYADLGQVVEAVLPVLGKHGLSITSGTVFIGDNFMLEVTLLHESGDGERTAVWPLPDPRRSGPQDIGSDMTYGRRYLTLALTGTYPGGEDDDGAKAQSYAQQERWDNARPQQAKPVSAPPAPPKTEWTDAEVFDYQTKISKSDVTLAVKGYDWMASNNLHERKVDYPTGDALTATQVLAFRLADLAAQPEADLAAIAVIRANAEDRGLLGTPVSDSTTLGEELDLVRDLQQRLDAEAADEPVQDIKAEVG
jgi:hypothetical protein